MRFTVRTESTFGKAAFELRFLESACAFAKYMGTGAVDDVACSRLLIGAQAQVVSVFHGRYGRC